MNACLQKGHQHIMIRKARGNVQFWENCKISKAAVDNIPGCSCQLYFSPNVCPQYFILWLLFFSSPAPPWFHNCPFFQRLHFSVCYTSCGPWCLTFRVAQAFLLCCVLSILGAISSASSYGTVALVQSMPSISINTTVFVSSRDFFFLIWTICKSLFKIEFVTILLVSRFGFLAARHMES